MSTDDNNPYVAPTQASEIGLRGGPNYRLREDEDPAVTLRFALTPEIIRQAVDRYENLYAARESRKTAVLCAFIAMIAIFWVYSPRELGVMARIGGGVAAVWLGIFILRFQKLQRRIERVKEANHEIEWRIGATKVDVISYCTYYSNAWESYIAGFKADDGLLLVIGPSFCQWLPRHAFASESDFELAVAWARAGIPGFIDMDLE